ncbi:MAG: class I SAM-dependent methyltransferase [Proteobacteria bacterium]|nr:class I SAM-dependent methyltransferase [Burkholderiales bacterium]
MPNRLRRLFVLGLFVPALGGAREPASAYGRITASPDGIGKTYMGREIARVMGWQGASWLERAEREDEERPDRLLAGLELRPGMVVADIGAGTGYYTRRIATLVGDSGRVQAVDAQPQMIALLSESIAKAGLRNVTTVQASSTDSRLAPASIDLALMVDVYHEFEFPEEMMTSIVRALKPGGRLVFVEYRAEDPRVPIKRLHKMSEAQVRAEAARHPLIWERSIPGLPWQHAIVFRRR